MNAMRNYSASVEERDKHEKHREGGRWVVNRNEPASLDYTNPTFGYHGDSETGSAYYVLLRDIATTQGLLHKIEHLSGKVWFDSHDFIKAVGEAFNVTY